MAKISFGHLYKKMPHGVQYLNTWVTGVSVVEFDDLSPQEVEQDTAIVGGGNYYLPHVKLIRVDLWSETIQGGHKWQTYRPHTTEKLEYYNGLKGQQVSVSIEKK
jgi:hypothetical protein